MASAFETISSLPAIRERATKVYQIAKAGNATNFELHEDRLDATIDVVVKVILVRAVSHTHLVKKLISNERIPFR